MADFSSDLRFSTIFSGKFRRYSHLTSLQHFTKYDVVFPNIRDAFFVLLGFFESLIRLILWRPNVVFLKGGYVCLPVGYAAWLLRVPIVIHDSDAHPGLTNRLLAPLAKHIATGVPLQYYNYPKEKSTYTGIPISTEYKEISPKHATEVKKSYGFSGDRPVTVFIGGGLGARRLNDNVVLHLKDLMALTDVVLISGTAQFDEIRALTPDDNRFRLEAFLSTGLPELLAAADLVVSRAGATALLEFAALSKPTILVPSDRLIWQQKHAQLFVDLEAVYPLDERKFTEVGDDSLVQAVKTVLTDKKLSHKLGSNLHKQAMPNAAKQLAEIILKTAGR